MLSGVRMADDRRRGNPLEESPNTSRQRAVQNAREQAAQAVGYGQCHRKHTAGNTPGMGEKAG